MVKIRGRVVRDGMLKRRHRWVDAWNRGRHAFTAGGAILVAVVIVLADINADEKREDYGAIDRDARPISRPDPERR